MTDATRPAARTPEFADFALRVACLALGVALWAPALSLMSRIWEQSQFFGHGYLIPLVSVYLLWRERKAILTDLREGEPGRFGWLVLAGVGLVEALAVLGEVSTAAGLGIPAVLLSSLYAVAGRRALRHTWLPISLLVFMVPPPGFILDRALVFLKLVVTEFAVELLQRAGFVVTSTGNQLLVPGHTLFMADACSGMTSIVTLLPLAVVLAYFASHGIWRRVVVIAAVAPLAIAANIVRVVVTVYLVSSHGIEYAQGLLHEGFGVSTYIGGTIALLLVARVLR